MKTRVVLLALCLLLFCLPCLSQSVTLAWDANTQPNLGGYKLWWGIATGTYTNSVDVAKVTTYKISGLTCGTTGTTYYFAATAYSNDPVPSQSPYSNEVHETILCAPTNFKITSTAVTQINRKDATLYAQTNKPASTTIQYGIGGYQYSRQVNAVGTEDHTITLSKLRPHTTYMFRWNALSSVDGSTDSATGTFTTD